MNNHWIYAQNPTIIYIGDPMCSWCYGFAPEISKIKEAYPDHELKIILGGLRPQGTETMADLGDFLAHHWDEVEKRTGQPFNHGIIGDSNIVLDTEPGCRAVVVARIMNEEIALDFFKAVQHAFFVENKNLQDVETFVAIAGRFNLDQEAYRKAFLSEEMRYETRADFQLASEMGIKGFPSVVVRHNGQLFLAANGYRTAEDLGKVISKITED